MYAQRNTLTDKHTNTYTLTIRQTDNDKNKQKYKQMNTLIGTHTDKWTSIQIELHRH